MLVELVAQIKMTLARDSIYRAVWSVHPGASTNNCIHVADLSTGASPLTAISIMIALLVPEVLPYRSCLEACLPRRSDVLALILNLFYLYITHSLGRRRLPHPHAQSFSVDRVMPSCSSAALYRLSALARAAMDGPSSVMTAARPPPTESALKRCLIRVFW